MAFNPGLKHLTTRLDGGVVWSANTSYLADNVVIFADASYRCMVNHTSAASFSTDLLAGRWVKLSADAINYILNSNPIVDTSGWSTYLNTASSQPVNGSGAGATVQWQRSTTTPLRGIADFNFVKTAVNSQGQGVSTDFTIDLADQAKVLTVTFDYEVLSGTYADGDLTVYLIADPIGTPVVIQPAGYVVQNATAGTKMKQIATFQTQATGQSYRLCFHVASVSALAYTLAIDNVVVGPQVVQYGSPVTDWQQYTPTLSSNSGTITNATVAAFWRRVGGQIEVRASIGFSGAVGTWSRPLLTLPFAADTSAGGGNLVYGFTQNARVQSGGVPYFNLYCELDSATRLRVFSTSASVGGGFSELTESSPVTINTTSSIVIQVSYPAAGLSSSVQMSNDTDTRVVAASVTGTPTGTLSAAYNKVTFPTVQVDTHSSYSSGTVRIPVSGIYRVSGTFCVSATWALNQQLFAAIYKGGSRIFQEGINAQGAVNLIQASITREIPLVAGDTIELYSFCTGGGSPSFDTGSGGQNHSFIVERLSGPSAIAASETVAVFASKTTGSQTDSGNFQDVSSWIVRDSTHGAFDATTGVFTAPISGRFLVTGILNFAGNATGSRAVKILKGLSDTVIGQIQAANGTGNPLLFSGYLQLLAGETVKLRAYQNSGGNLSYTASTEFGTTISFIRVGN